MSEPAAAREPDPGQPKPPEWYRERPQARMSFTRLSVYRRCPAWYRYQYLEWHRTWDIPVMRAGHAVQGALEKTFDGVPAADVASEDLETRARMRAVAHFRKAWEEERTKFEADPNAAGTWGLSRDRYEAYVLQGVRWHVQEALARVARRHPRTGAALDLPPVSVAGAWEAVRPWHAPKGDGDDFGLDTVPGGWFQGQYDLVYSWTGGRRIVDLKASAGTSVFASEIEGQLLSYAWMERESGRGLPEGLEGWFLGQGSPRTFPIPDVRALDAFTGEARTLIRSSRSEEDGFNLWSAAEFPATPSAVPGAAPREGEPSAWCGVCPFAYVCPQGRRRVPPPGAGTRFDAAIPLGRPVAIEGLVLGVGRPRVRNGKEKSRITIANESGVRSFGWDKRDVDRLASAGLRAGRHVRITALNPWRPPDGGTTHLFSTPQSRLDVLADPWPDAILGSEE